MDSHRVFRCTICNTYFNSIQAHGQHNIEQHPTLLNPPRLAVFAADNEIAGSSRQAHVQDFPLDLSTRWQVGSPMQELPLDLSMHQNIDDIELPQLDDLFEMQELNDNDLAIIDEIMAEDFDFNFAQERLTAERRRELADYRDRFCSICVIKFERAGDLDVHRFSFHRETYDTETRPVIQVGAGGSSVDLDVAPGMWAFDGTVVEYVGNLTRHVYADASGVFTSTKPALFQRMREFLTNFGPFKIIATALVEMIRDVLQDPNEVDVEDFPFSSFLHTVLNESQMENIALLMSDKIAQTIEEFIRRGSGWRISRFKEIRFRLLTYRMDGGRGWIETPRQVKNKKCVINIRNDDDYCFKYAILAGLNPIYQQSGVHWRVVTSPETYANLPSDIFWDCIKFPMTIEQMDKFHHFNPHISVNVYGCEEQDELEEPTPSQGGLKVFPLYVSQQNRQNHVDLLLIIEGENSHFTLLRKSGDNPSYGLSRLIGKNRNYQKFVCKFCLCFSTSLEHLKNHQERCIVNVPQTVRMPYEQFYSFNETRKTLPAPFVIYCDFEAILRPKQGIPTRKIGDVYNEHIPCGWAFAVVGPLGNLEEEVKVYCGENAAVKLIQELISTTEKYFVRMKIDVGRDPRFSAADFRHILSSAEMCIHCEKRFVDIGEDPVLDHCHMTGMIRGASCNSCNLQARVRQEIPVLFHNFRSYDSKFIVQAVRQSLVKNVYILPQTSEKFTSITLVTHSANKIKFVDTFQFITSSLSDQVDVLGKENFDRFTITKSHFCNYQNNWNLLFRKAVYPYTYMDKFERLQETSLPDKAEFANDLTGEQISEQDYEHAHRVWNAFKCRTLEDYHNLYVQLDVCLLADCFENLRNTMLTNIRLDPTHYVSLPGIAYDCCMKVGKVRFEFLRHPDDYAFFESGIRGGISAVGLRYAKANNKYMGELYDSSMPTSFLCLWDANLLYSTCLRAFVPCSNFRWDSSLCNRTDNLQAVCNMILDMKDEGKEGLVLEVDLLYPEELHDLHNDYPLAVSHHVIQYEDLSPYTKEVMSNVGVTAANCRNSKLAGTLHAKHQYIVHYRLLKLFLQLGLKLTKVHRAIRFDQQPLFRVYTDMCIQKRRDATSAVEKMFWKNMGNILAGKLMQNVRKQRRINMALRKEQVFGYGKKPTVEDFKILHEECVLFMMKKLSVCLNKPIFAGFTVLEDSKRIMYDFYYNHLKTKYGENMRLVMTDTDSFLLHIKTEDVYTDIFENINSTSCRFDTSNFDPKHPSLGHLHSLKFQGAGAFFKDECANSVIMEAVALKPKLYSLRTLRSDGSIGELKKAKGTVRSVVRNQMRFQDFLDVLNQGSAKNMSMNTIRSLDHKLYTTTIIKKSLSALEDKNGYYISPIESLRFGHYKIKEYQQNEFEQ